MPDAAPDRLWRPYPEGGEHTVVGDLRVLEGFYSPRLENRRDVLVLLPPSYPSGGRRYPVVYMHDGQNLFDRAASFAGEWGVDEAMAGLAERGLEAIVVGVPNAGAARLDEYGPFRDARHGGGRGARYLGFLAGRLKPRVDRDFRTLPGAETTAIAGSSMGGLFSLYAAFERPDVFGAAGAVSPSLWFADRAVFPYLEGRFAAGGARPARVYLDAGTEEGADTLQDARRMRDLLLEGGYREGADPGGAALRYVEAEGAGHTEAAWGARFGDAARFLLEGATGWGGSAARTSG